jgi:hypothetical protein
MSKVQLTPEEAMKQRMFDNCRTMTLYALQVAGFARVLGLTSREILAADNAASEAIRAWGEVCKVPTEALFRAFTEITRAKLEELEPLILGLKGVVRGAAKNGQTAGEVKAAA